MNVQAISDYLRSLFPRPFPEEGVRHGDPRMEVTSVLVCWMANTRAIARAAEQGCNLIVCHEIPFFASRYEKDTGQYAQWKANRLRKDLLDRHGIAIVQSHRTLDSFCVANTFQERLGLGAPAVVEDMAGYDAVRLFEIEPQPVARYIEQWKQALGLDRVRTYVRDPGRIVRRAGLAWGGIGLYSNLSLIARLADLQADVLIGGETEEYTIEFCVDAGMDFVELGHAASEAPGMTAAGRHLAGRFPGLKVASFEEWPLMRVR